MLSPPPRPACFHVSGVILFVSLFLTNWLNFQIVDCFTCKLHNNELLQVLNELKQDCICTNFSTVLGHMATNFFLLMVTFFFSKWSSQWVYIANYPYQEDKIEVNISNNMCQPLTIFLSSFETWRKLGY